MVMVKRITCIILFCYCLISCVKEEGRLNIKFQEELSISFTAHMYPDSTILNCNASLNSEEENLYFASERVEDAQIFFINDLDSTIVPHKDYYYEAVTNTLETEKNYSIYISHDLYGEHRATASSVNRNSITDINVNIDSITVGHIHFSGEAVLDEHIEVGNLELYLSFQIDKKDSLDNLLYSYIERVPYSFHRHGDYGELNSSSILYNGNGQFTSDSDSTDFNKYNFSIKCLGVKSDLISITKSYWDYITDLRISYFNSSDPYAEPIIPISNMTNGMGYFSLIIHDTQEFDFD